MKNLTILIAAVFIACFSYNSSESAQEEAGNGGPPEKFVPLYKGIEDCLDNLERQVESLPENRERPERPLTLGAELLAANSNRGKILLEERTFKGVLIYLESLKSMGMKGVTIQIGYPIFMDQYPRSQEYLAFYKKLAAAIKDAGLILHAKTGPSFTQPEFSAEKIDYSNLTLEAYLDGRKKQALLIAREIAPHYLTVVNEPSTEKTLTGLDISPEDQKKFVEDILKELGPTRKTLIGAGAGTWDKREYIRAFAAIPDLDFIDLHIYPVFGNCLESAVSCSNWAVANNKRLIIGEAWLYKSLGHQFAGRKESWTEVFSRDVFSFWQPLDEKFITALIKFARSQRAEYLSLFWSRYLFAYVPYNDYTSKLSPAKLLKNGDMRAAAGIIFHQLSKTGQTYKNLINQQKTD